MITAILLVLLTMTGCEEVLHMDLNETAPKIVIEGLMTDKDPVWVKISKTQDFYDTADFQAINTALITVKDDLGNIDTLNFKGHGLYGSDRFIGKAGRNYYLFVQAEGKEYHAQSYLPPLLPLDSVTYKKYAVFDGIHEEGYYPALYFKDPPESKNYYLLVYYKNSKLLNKRNDLQVADDEGLQQNIMGYEIPYVLQPLDTFTIKMFSMSKEVYQFYDQLSLQLINDGGSFSAPPANAKGNFSNNALGCFRTSSVQEASVVIKK